MKRLTQYIVMLLILLSAGLAGYAQGGRQMIRKQADQRPAKPRVAKRIEAIKRGYISQRLALTPDQAVRFWPLYDQYQGELEEIVKMRKKIASEPAGPDSFNRDLDNQQRIPALQKRYYEEFSRILGTEKASLVFKSERDFRAELFKRLTEQGTSGPSAEAP